MPIAGWDIRCPRGGQNGDQGKLIYIEVACSKLVAVAVDWQKGNRGLAGKGRGLGHGPANDRKGPVKRL
jgi:hypothetical protein